jgi:uncharacterized protein
MSDRLDEPLDEAELDEFEEWMLSDDSPEECMDISMLDGFLTAIVSGPVVMPTEYLPVVWSTPDWKGFRSIKQARRILNLITRVQNEVALSLYQDPDHFVPRFYEKRILDPPVVIADEWCYGYMRGVELRKTEWSWLLDDANHVELFKPILAMAYFEGEYDAEYERIHADAELFERTKAAIAPSVVTIYELWRKRLFGPVRRAMPKISPNATCPCGSGKKYKRCCGAA